MPWEDDADDEGTISCQMCGDDLDSRDERAELVERRLCLDCADEVERIIDAPIDELQGL